MNKQEKHHYVTQLVRLGRIQLKENIDRGTEAKYKLRSERFNAILVSDQERLDLERDLLEERLNIAQNIERAYTIVDDMCDAPYKGARSTPDYTSLQFLHKNCWLCRAKDMRGETVLILYVYGALKIYTQQEYEFLSECFQQEWEK